MYVLSCTDSFGFLSKANIDGVFATREGSQFSLVTNEAYVLFLRPYVNTDTCSRGSCAWLALYRSSSQLSSPGVNSAFFDSFLEIPTSIDRDRLRGGGAWTTSELPAGEIRSNLELSQEFARRLFFFIIVNAFFVSKLDLCLNRGTPSLVFCWPSLALPWPGGGVSSLDVHRFEEVSLDLRWCSGVE